MGASIATNSAKQIITNTFDIANSYNTTCATSISNDFTLAAGGNCKQSVGEIDISQGNYINASCMQNATTSNNMKTDISTQIMSQVNAMVQSLGGPAASISTNIQDFAQTTAESITNNYTTACTGTIQNNNKFTCVDSAEQSIGIIKITGDNKAYTNCIASDTTRNEMQSTITTILKNTVSAKEADTLIGVVAVIVIFLGIFGVIFVRTLNGPIGWVIIIILIILGIALIVYGSYAFINKLYPFKPSV